MLYIIRFGRAKKKMKSFAVAAFELTNEYAIFKFRFDNKFIEIKTTVIGWFCLRCGTTSSCQYDKHASHRFCHLKHTINTVASVSFSLQQSKFCVYAFAFYLLINVEWVTLSACAKLATANDGKSFQIPFEHRVIWFLYECITERESEFSTFGNLRTVGSEQRPHKKHTNPMFRRCRYVLTLLITRTTFALLKVASFISQPVELHCTSFMSLLKFHR